MQRSLGVFGGVAAMTLAGGVLAPVASAAPPAAPQRPIQVAFILQALNPQKIAGAKIRSTGRLRVSHKRTISIKVYGQRKVCGFFGCNWHNKAEKGVGKAWATDTGWVRVTQKCVRGQHRYRTLSHGFVREPLGVGSASKLSAGLLFRC